MLIVKATVLFSIFLFGIFIAVSHLITPKVYFFISFVTHLTTNWSISLCSKWQRFPVIFEETESLLANVWNHWWHCWPWSMQETRNLHFRTRENIFAPAVMICKRCDTYVRRRSMQCTCHEPTFRADLLRMGLAVTRGSGGKARDEETGCYGIARF